jgi:hypothetical protein
LSNQQSFRTLPWVVFAAALIAYLLTLLVSGRLCVPDDIFYKCAGLHWAVDGHFAAPELTGRLHVDPPLDKIFACYPPAYPFLFAIYTKIVGFGWRQLMFFDALIHAGLCVMLALATRRLLQLASAPSDWLAPVIGLVAIPLGNVGRPDELAMIFGLGALIARLDPNRPSLARTMVAGVLLGLCANVSLVPASIYFTIAVTWLILDLPMRRAIGHLLVMGAIAAVILALAIVPLLIAEPHALRQFRAHAALATGGAKHGLVEIWRWALGYDPYTITLTAAVVCAAIVLLFSARKRESIRLWLRFCAGALIGVLGIVLISDAKWFYLWFAGAWLLVATTVLAMRSPRAPLNRLALLFIAVGVIVGSARFVRERLVIASLPPSQRISAAGARVESLIPPGSRVLTSDYWAILAPSCHVYDERFVSPNVLDRIDYVVVAADFGGQADNPAPVRDELAPYVAAHFQPIDVNAADHVETIFGHPITRGIYGFGACVMKRVR